MDRQFQQDFGLRSEDEIGRASFMRRWRIVRHSKSYGDYTMRSEGLSLKLLAAALAVLLPIGGPSPRAAQNSDQGIRVQVNLVNLFATVRDKKTKQIISGLEQNDFKITEDGVEQKISFFSRE